MPVDIRAGAAFRWYAVVTLALTAAYPVLPSVARPWVFLTVPLSAVPAVARGVRRSSRGDRLPWWLLLAAMMFLNAGNIVWMIHVNVQGNPTADGTLADFMFTVANVLMLSAALFVVVRRGRKDIGGIIDAAIVGLAVGGLVWDTVLLPHLTATQGPLSRQIALFTDVFVMMASLGALGRVALVAAERIVSLHLMLAAMICGLAGHIVVALVSHPDRARPDWTAAMFLAGYVAVGCAGLHPSSALVTRLGPEPEDDLTIGRLAFLGFSLAAVPLIGGGRVILGLPTDGLLLALGSACVIPLVMVRIARLSSQRRRAERALVHLANHDKLTGLPNRSACMDRLTSALGCLGAGSLAGSGAAQTSASCGVAVMFCDLDGFKPVNDRLGHAAGDQLLAAVADRLRACVRGDDLVSRFGGDEFVVVCHSDRPQEATELMCERIREALLRPFYLGGETVHLGVSVGAAMAGPGCTADELIGRADAAMYVAKRSKSIGALTLVMA